MLPREELLICASCQEASAMVRVDADVPEGWRWDRDPLDGAETTLCPECNTEPAD